MEEQIQSQNQSQDLIKEISLPIFQSKGWLKLLGVVMILQGIFMAITVFGIIFCWLPIWMGVLLFQAANQIEGAQFQGSKPHLLDALTKLKTYFMINGILMLVMIIIAGIGLLIFGASIFAVLSSGEFGNP